MKKYKDKETLEKYYDLLGSTRLVARTLDVSSSTIIRYMREHHIPRSHKLYLYKNNSWKGRRCELYVKDFPFFKNHFKDVGEVDDKAAFDGYWFENKVNIKSTHSKGRKSFRIKRKKRHNVFYYICCVYDDDIDPLIPIEIYVIPAKFAPHSTITISLNPNSKYERFRLKSGIDFDPIQVDQYNKWFKDKYLFQIAV